MTADRPARGIRRTVSGWQVYVRVNGEYRSKRFPADTDLIDLKTHRDRMKARGWLHQPEPNETPGSFAADCATYLELVQGMTTYKDRAYRIRQWRDALGPQTARGDITSVVIRQTLEKWRVTGLSPASLNLRRTALLHLYTVLDGKSGKNPVKDVPPYREVPKRLELPTLKDAKKVIGRMQKGSPIRARCLVLLWTGWPPSLLMRITPADLDLKHGKARVPARRKGKGVPARTLPLLPQAVQALKELHKADAFGPFDVHNLRHRLQKACRREHVKPFTPYSLRHLFLSTVALATKDDRVVAELAMHADIRMTRRYTESTVDPRLTEGLKAVQHAIQARPRVKA